MSDDTRNTGNTGNTEDAGDTGGSEILARRYRALLLAYPEAWRTQRGEEMLGTLLDAAEPGRRRPSMRESVSILAQGTRERLDLRRRRTPGTVWVEGLQIGALVLLGQAFAGTFINVLETHVYTDPQLWQVDWLTALHVLGIVFGIAALTAVVTGRTLVAAMLTALWSVVPVGPDGISWQPVVAFAILAGLSVRGGPRERRRISSVWLAVVPLVVALWVGLNLVTGTFVHPPYILLYPVALVLAITVGAVLDPRLPIAAACPSVALVLYTALHVPAPFFGDRGGVFVRPAPAAAVFAAIAVALLTIGHVRARRLARI